jgi:predicted nucleic acid-binding protein
MSDRVFVDTNVIVSAAQAIDCRYLLTEDFQEDQTMGNIEVINPFRTSPDSI